MVTVSKKIIGNKTYYYLEHTYRLKNDVLKKEKYLGTAIPKNLEMLKKEFLHEIYKEKWYLLLEHIREESSREHKRLPPTAQEKERESFMIRFTYDTQRIEGSTLTLKETANLLEKGITPANKPLSDVKEAEAHSRIFYEMLQYKKDLSLSVVLYWHRKLLENTKPDIAGKIRKHQVAISGSKFMPPSPVEVDLLLNDFLKWYSKNKQKLHPVELAALAHLKFVTIHPFTDGKGRISRLLMNFVLNKHGYPLLNISYKNRSSYYTALERAQVKQHDSIFVQWLFKRYVKEHKQYSQE